MVCKRILICVFFVSIWGCSETWNTVQPRDHSAAEKPDLELRPSYFPDTFQAVSIQGHAPKPFIEGNSLEGVRTALEQGVRHVEIDFRMSADGRIIAAHGKELGGDCPDVEVSTAALLRACAIEGGLSVVMLEDVLALDFERIFIDLKTTQDSAERANRAARTVIEAIVDSDRTHDTFFMTYQATPEIVDLVQKNNIRAGLKGYPESLEETSAMIDTAAASGFEMMCINLDQLSPELVEYSARMGIWQMPWHLGGRRGLSKYKRGARAGIGGLITRSFELVNREVTPEWRDIRSRLPSTPVPR